MPSLVALYPPLLLLYIPSYLLHLYRVLLPLRPAPDVTLVRLHGKLREANIAHPDSEMTVERGVSLERIAPGDLPYCEDVVVWGEGEDRVAIFSCDPSRDVYNPFAAEGDPAKAQPGRLVAYPLGDGRAEAYDIVHDFASELHPLGVGVHRTQPILAVANLNTTRPSVEIFRLTAVAGKLRGQHLRTLAHPSLSTPNAVVPLSEDTVLVTNSFRYSAQYSKILNTLETFLAVPGGMVLCLTATDSEDAKCEVLARGIALANGLALSDDGSVLAVAGCLTANIHIYNVYPALLPDAHDVSMAGRLSYRESIPAGFMVDNLRFVRTDTHHVFLACGHPSGLDFTKCAKSHGAQLSGTRAAAVRVPKVGKKGWLNAMFTRVDDRITPVFEDGGRILGSGATACSDGSGGLIVTGLFDKRGPIRCASIEL
ncbi:hypothetical protein CC85DRAFT_289359 [Cutaneotrichosporon oleaginosum]|uniref:Calcium-dependent phosphotriesterase n=1 Tax=Cutaneotrichosporon oleaginosum TaxID=879819 RepID=A0A0J0XC32_9TREE|nr:uncharacterized protein CC85DRAFT_289359 [Cutaneotrichosporon oleaginosum]KLT38612.1 hypothetical protein CC85DRAFT_289359 [Cutaneotrichosporon oleaginosum]TXT05811.1 hypothetical protein COLE_07131 [Cutaneotrichosporon oleaginosum]